MEFREAVVEGIPDYLPELQEYDLSVSHAPKAAKMLDFEHAAFLRDKIKELQ